ncbi:HlyD family efflux transporter periplasmic adaptor subunit [Synechococcus sp. PROS-U-1]|uniref:HlyD family efflux transporter periplasmic adaptor subunit n=1 Tax=Synechococcus sp. PROS-U-1 TaxID=1400866 RepID=UPI00185FF436|nr:HlyD family efflux transporter periplasmic adaptor subunit [Synechococcus sp. PROS-U-1]QNJ01781.1 hlyD secretion family protein [Synechococcus sp. PROS-U-1]
MPPSAPITEESKSKKKLQVWDGSAAMVEQGRHWSSALIWTFALLFGSTLLWAFTAKLDQTITVRGRIVPAGRVRDVESPSAGVISQVHVTEGQLIARGDPLFTVEAKGLSSRRQALLSTVQLLDLQAEGMQGILSSGGDPDRLPPLPTVPVVADPDQASKLLTANQQALQMRSQLVQLANKLASARQTLELKTAIAADMKPLFDSGGMSRNAYLEQLNRLQEIKSNVANLEEERSKVMGQVASQLNQTNRQLLGLRAELEGLKESISYRTVKAPSAGQVFDTAIKRSDVVNTSEIALKIVPRNRLEASVNIQDRDIGFVKLGMPASVSVDSFPSGEFGYITGEVKSLGLDALPPTQETQAYSFPASISLDQQEVLAGDNKLNLQSGMAVSANIKLRSRPVISIVTDMFTKQLEGVKRFR